MDNLTTTVDELAMRRNNTFVPKKDTHNNVRPVLSSAPGVLFTRLTTSLSRNPAWVIVLIVAVGVASSVLFVGKSSSVLEKKINQRYALLEAQIIGLVDKKVAERRVPKSSNVGLVENAKLISRTPEFTSLVREKVEDVGSIYFSSEMIAIEQRISDSVTKKVDELKSEELKDIISAAVKDTSTVYIENFMYETFTKDLISLRERVDEMNGLVSALQGHISRISGRVEDEVRAVMKEEKKAAMYLEHEREQQEELARKQAELEARRTEINKALDEMLKRNR